MYSEEELELLGIIKKYIKNNSVQIDKKIDKYFTKLMYYYSGDRDVDWNRTSNHLHTNLKKEYKDVFTIKEFESDIHNFIANFEKLAKINDEDKVVFLGVGEIQSAIILDFNIFKRECIELISIPTQDCCYIISIDYKWCFCFREFDLDFGQSKVP